MRAFLTALQFLTRVPIRLPGDLAPEDLPRSMLYYPAVGLMIGLALVIVNRLGSAWLPPGLVAVLILVGLILITGGLHLDGFADMVDGFYAGRNPQEILAIMKDSHIGAMGVVGLICLLLFKFVLLQSLSPDVINSALLLMPVMGRWSMVMVAATSSYARPEGTGKPYVGCVGVREWLGATAITASAALLSFRWWKGVILCSVVLLITLALTAFTKRKIGGVTGDTLGATGEIIEALTLFVILIIHSFKL